jgi:hypothetical protein
MNAKEEFIKTISAFEAVVLCAQIRLEHSYDNNIVFTLNQNYTDEELFEFLNNLDFEYNNSYGKQYLFGTIWCKHNIWFTRSEYDGAEGWEYHEYPKLPERKPTMETFSTNWYAQDKN